MSSFPRNLVYFVLSGLILLASGNDVSQSKSASSSLNQEGLPDPVRNFFSELGDLFLTVDKTFSSQTAPKTNFADALKEQIYVRLRRPDHDYFERIQENYKDLQKRVLTTVTKATGDKTASGTRNKNGENFVDIRLPLPPFRLTTNSKLPDVKNELVQTGSDDKDLPKQILPTETSIQDSDRVGVADSTTVDSENSKAKSAGHLMSPLEITWKDFQKRMESVPVSQRLKVFPTEDEIKIAVNRFLKDVPQSQEILTALRERGVNVLSVSRTGDVMEEMQVDKDSVEESEQPESAFDNYVKHLVENQERWFVEFPLKRKNSTEQNKDQAEDISTTTQDSTSNTETDSYTEATTTDESVWSTVTDFSSDEVSTEIPTSTEALVQDIKTTDNFPSPNEMNFLPNHYYETDEDPSAVQYVIDPESLTEATEEAVTDFYQENEPTDRLVLAFTPDGVPLKLRIDAEIENPINYLHEILTVAGVSLNIPIASFESIEPVGSEVLQIGAGDEQTRTSYIDIANNEELKSLVETLRVSRNLKENIAT